MTQVRTEKKRDDMRFSMAMSTRPTVVDRMDLEQARDAVQALSEYLDTLTPGEVIMIRREIDDHN